MFFSMAEFLTKFVKNRMKTIFGDGEQIIRRSHTPISRIWLAKKHFEREIIFRE